MLCFYLQYCSPLCCMCWISSLYICDPVNSICPSFFHNVILSRCIVLISHLVFLFLPFCCSPLMPFLVSISPPDAGPQLCGVLVLLPTWAERLFPPGPLPGANDGAVPGQCQPLPHIQPQQQVGGQRTAWNSDYESSWTLIASWFQKCGLQSWLF